jgi:hypothetical protein
MKRATKLCVGCDQPVALCDCDVRRALSSAPGEFRPEGLRPIEHAPLRVRTPDRDLEPRRSLVRLIDRDLQRGRRTS